MPQVNFIPVMRSCMRSQGPVGVSQRCKPSLVPFKAVTHGQELVLQHMATPVTRFHDWHTINLFPSLICCVFNVIHGRDEKKFGSSCLDFEGAGW